MKLSLGFSTCPNDTYIFDAAVNGKIDTEGIDFEVTMADVEELNKLAFEGKIDITKLSINAFLKLKGKYTLLSSGGALGFNNGPMLISKREISIDHINDLKIGIPGFNTTANLLLSIAFPEAKNKKEYLFSDLETAILNNEIDAGLIIHESRFTYKDKGLIKIIDLGEYWEQDCGLPLPLGGIAINKKHDIETALKVTRIIRRSIEFANKNPESSLEYMRKYAQEIEPGVMKKHVELYVNEYSLDFGRLGMDSINHLFTRAVKQGLIERNSANLFIES